MTPGLLQSSAWLITGGLGFIGVNLLLRLVADRARVRVLDHASAGRTEELASLLPAVARAAPQGLVPGQIELLRGDVRDLDLLRAAARGTDVLVHLAAQTGVVPSIEHPLADCDANVRGTATALVAARDAGVRRFVLASSNAVLGAGPSPLREDHLPAPVSPYGASKLAGEAYCAAFRAAYGLETVALRFSNVYGPHCGRKGSVVATFLRRAREGRPLSVHGDGAQTRDLVHVADVTAGILSAATTPGASGCYQLGSGQETSVLALAELVVRLVEPELGRRPAIERLPARAGDVRRSVSDIGRAQAELGYTPRIELSPGLRSVWDWFLRDVA